jgi:hypothetical protein
MGRGMAIQLLKAGFALTVFNRTSERAKPLLEMGASLAANPREAAENEEVVISMVAEDKASRGVWLGSEGALSGVKPKTLLIESSTLSSKWVEQLATEAVDRACAFLDAPVTGSKPQAESGQLVFLVGGDPAGVGRTNGDRRRGCCAVHFKWSSGQSDCEDRDATNSGGGLHAELFCSADGQRPGLVELDRVPLPATKGGWTMSFRRA